MGEAGKSVPRSKCKISGEGGGGGGGGHASAGGASR